MGYSVVLNYLFRIFSKISIYKSALEAGIWNNYLKLNFIELFFFSTLAVSLGFCFTAYIWMSGRGRDNCRNRLKKGVARANSLFIFGIILLVLTRYFTIHLNSAFQVEEYLGDTIFLFPAYIYLYNWNFISKIYNSRKIFIATTLFGALFSLLLTCVEGR